MTRRTVLSTAVLVTVGLALGVRVADATPTTQRLKTSDDSTVNVRVFAPDGGATGRPAVVAVAEMGRRPTVWDSLSARCNACGITLVTVEHRLSDPVAALSGDITKGMEGMNFDAAAALKYVREELGARDDGVALLGDGQGAIALTNAAAADAKVVGLVAAGGLPSTIGIAVYTKGWNERPVAVVVNEGDDAKAVKPLQKLISKESFIEGVVVRGPAGKHGTKLFGSVPGLEDRLVERLYAWLSHPALDGVPDEAPTPDGPLTAHHRAGAAGGVTVSGHLAKDAGRLTSVEVLVHPRPADTSLSAESRRLVLKAKSGKTDVVAVEVFAWDGRHWKSQRKAEIAGLGGFLYPSDGPGTYEVWLSAALLDVPPFTKIAVASAGVAGKLELWSGLPPADGSAAPASSVDVANPSTWTAITLE